MTNLSARDNVVERLNQLVHCGCCDDEWPQLRHDTVHLIDALSAGSHEIVAAIYIRMEAARKGGE
jgi:hypothetical protein